MSQIRNAKVLLTNPEIARDFAAYSWSRLAHSGQAIRRFPDGLRISGFSGFSEFHASGEFVSPEEWAFFRTHPLGAGDLIDVGANLGLVTAILARRFPDRQVHAFEPNPSTFQALQANMALNGLANVQTSPAALADHSGTIPFRADPIDRGMTSIARTTEEDSLLVPCTTLDAYLDEHATTEVALLKIDVEGFETLVLQGASRLLEHRRAGLIYFEVCPNLTRDAGFDPTEPARRLIEAGYRLHRLNPQGTLEAAPLDDLPRVSLENWIAVAP